jgi:beta-glucosidase-like glycosyl hydrolase/CubicO group peptidase (beta-lactamase class C family)
MVMCRAYGYYYSTESDEYRRLVRLVRDEKIGGVALFQGDVLETAVMMNRLQEMADVPLLIAGDFEWGAAMRIRRSTRFPEAMAIGATRDTALAFRSGVATGEEARAIGVGMDFAPVADVNVNPDNPVINTRSFGENPELVAAMATAFANGLRSAGVLATAKHFPGHGDTQTDSHLNLPLLPHSRVRLDTVELVPFQRLIKSGVASVMVGHLEVPSLQYGRSYPATLSPYVINGLLKHDLGFTGLVVTDAMDMGALVNSYGSDSAAVLAVEAGVDLLLILPDETRSVAAIASAVRTGRISQDRIDASVRKILSQKSALGLPANRMVDIKAAAGHVGTRDHLALARQVARQSITVLRNDHVLPLERFGGKRILSVIVADAENYRTEIHRSSSQWSNEPVGDYFMAQLRKRTTTAQSFHIDPSTNELDLDLLLKSARRTDIILCPLFSKARSGSGQFGLPESITKIVDTLCSFRKPVVLIAMGSPYILSAFARGSAYLCTYSDAEASTDALVEALFGEIRTQGRLPVTIPDRFEFGAGIDLSQTVLRRDLPESVGMSRDSLALVDSIITRAIRDSAFPGAELLVAKDGAVIDNKAYGTLSYDYGSPPVDPSTMYDIASMTKVIATTSAVMRLCDEGTLRLSDPVAGYLPAFATHGKERITLNNLLLHNGGLPAFKPLFQTCSSPQQILDSVYETEMIYRTGDSTVYSDFDFILLGKIVEAVTGTTLDHYVDSVFLQPLGMTRTMFRPPEALWENIAPTEFDSTFRKTLVRGVVHDENAFALGGVSGHAGLFSTASDLAVLMQMVLNGGTYGGREYLKPETVRLFTSRQGAKGTRALGWDMKSMNGYSTAGSLMGGTTFGHTGFTGTSVWADPDKKITIIFLTNRVHPTRANAKIGKVRPLVHDAVMRSYQSGR